MTPCPGCDSLATVLVQFRKRLREADDRIRKLEAEVKKTTGALGEALRELVHRQ